MHETTNTVIPQWIEAVARDFNHPSIVGWCPLNETHIDRYGNGEKIHDAIVRNIYFTTKALDKTRPCIDTSGYVHQKFTDIYDMHNYTQDPEHMRSDYAEFENGGAPVDEKKETCFSVTEATTTVSPCLSVNSEARAGQRKRQRARKQAGDTETTRRMSRSL